MDALKNYFAQIKDLYYGMTPGNRITIALLFGFLILSFGFLVLGTLRSGTSDRVYVFSGKVFTFSEQTAAAEVLAKANLNDYEWKGGKLEVKKSEEMKYTGAIADGKVITDLGGYLTAAVNGLGAYESGKMMDLKMRAATAEQLAATLEQYPWIEKAAVNIYVRHDMDLKIFQRIPIVSAAVNIRPLFNEEISEEQATAVTMYIAGALGIKESDLREIKIIDMRSQRSWYGHDLKARGGNKTYEDMQKFYENKWNNELRNLFAEIPGLIVQTHVLLDKKLSRQEHDVAHGKPTTVGLRERTTDLDKKERDIAGRPGFAAQLGLPVPNQGPSVIAGATVKEKTEDSETTNALQGVEGETRLAPLTPRLITATIRIPLGYIKRYWVEQNATVEEPNPVPSPTDIENARIELFDKIKADAAKIMEPLVPEDAPDTKQFVQVSHYLDPTEPEEKEETAFQLALSWVAQNWETLSLLALIVLGIGVLWAMTRVKQPEPIVIYEAPEIPLNEEMLSEDEMTEEDIQIQRTLDPFNKSIRSLQSEVADLVTENPDAAASVLRQWIGNVAFQES